MYTCSKVESINMEWVPQASPTSSRCPVGLSNFSWSTNDLFLSARLYPSPPRQWHRELSGPRPACQLCSTNYACSHNRNILQLPFRRSHTVSLSDAITQYISSKYDQRPDMFAEDLMIIDRLRSEAVNVQEPHFSGISRLITYAAQLKWLGGKFPIDVRGPSFDRGGPCFG